MGTNINNIKVVFWNAQSICNKDKIFEFFNFLNEEHIDVGIVTETWLKYKNKLYDDKYVCYRVDRVDESHGGVAIVIKKNIKHQLMPAIKTKTFETIAVKVLLDDSEVVIIGTYFRGGNPSQLLKNNFSHDLNLFNRINYKYIIAGDFNCRHAFWNYGRQNSWGKMLYDTLITSNYELIAPSSPTHFPRAAGRAPSTIDLMLTNFSTFITPLIVVQKLNSDHLPVTFEIKKQSIRNTPTYRFVYNKANWPRYSKKINELVNLDGVNIDNFTTPQNIDNGIENIIDCIEQAKEFAIPKKTVNNRPCNTVTLPSYIKDMIHTRNWLRRRWQRSHNQMLKRDINYINKLISDQILHLSNEKWSSKLRALEKGSKPLWNLAKVLKKKNKNLPPIITADGVLLTNQEKADEFAKFFALQHQNNSSSNVFIEKIVAKSITDLNAASVTNLNLITPREIKTIIRFSKNNKAAGPNGISNKLLKNLPKRAIIFITYLFNACLKISYFPDPWKIASLVCVPKANKDIRRLDGYRPISLLDCLGKIFEKCIKSRINDHVESKSIIPDEQFGFRAGYSTCHQLFRIKNIVQNNFKNNKSTGMIVLDVQNAFNSVWHDGLIHKMSTLKFPSYIIKLIRSFLNNRRFRVMIKDIKSNTFGISAGVPQGSTLSPILYNIFTSDIPIPLGTDMGLYADDTAILTADESVATIINNLKNAFNSISNYFSKWKININTSKTQAIFFSRRRKIEYLPITDLNLNGQLVPWKDSIKYLGLHLDKKLTFKTHIDLTIKKCDNIIKLLYPIINRRSKLSVENKILIYKVMFQSVLLYGSPVWSNCAITHRKKLQVKQNKILKMMFDLPWFFSTSTLHKNSGVQEIVQKVELLNTSFHNSVAMLNNQLINTQTLM